jgi:hypothetical protein
MATVHCMITAPHRCTVEVGLQELRSEQLIGVVGHPAAELGTGIKGDETALARCKCRLHVPTIGCHNCMSSFLRVDNKAGAQHSGPEAGDATDICMQLH